MGYDMKEINDYSTKKAQETFDSLPYTFASEKEYRKFLRKKDSALRRSRSRRLIRIMRNTAAVLFVPLLALALVPLFEKWGKPAANALSSDIDCDGCVEYVVNPGVKGHITLPDGSEVWLNSKSSLKCPAVFDSSFRMVELNGEAYFKVMRQTERPMIIKTSKDLCVKVLGTEFNLTAYDEDNSVKLTLVTGEVELLSRNGSNNESIKVHPAEEVVIYDKGISLPDSKKEVDDAALDNSHAWREGYLIFNNTPMPEVIKILERWYGVKFNPTDPVIENFRFTARFKTESVTRVLDLLSISSNIKYRIEENIITLYL